MAVLDHLVLAADDLDGAVSWLESELGVRPAAGGSHPGLGTRNALAGLGDGAYLEVIAPDPEQPDPPRPRPFGVDDVGAPRLVAFAVRPDTSASEDPAGLVERCRRAGHDPGEVGAMSRTTPDGRELRWHLTSPSPRDVAIPFLIEWDTGVHPSASAPAGLRLESIEVAVDDQARRVVEALGLDVDLVPAGDGGDAAVAVRATLVGAGGRRLRL